MSKHHDLFSREGSVPDHVSLLTVFVLLCLVLFEPSFYIGERMLNARPLSSALALLFFCFGFPPWCFGLSRFMIVATRLGS